MRSPRNQAGLSIVELMVSIALGLLILAGVITIFANNSRTRGEIEKTSRQIENGRYAIQLITEDLQMSGYLGELVPPTSPTPQQYNFATNAWGALAALPDPCAVDLPTLRSAMAMHIQGYDNNSGALGCIPDVRPGTDVLVVRRASTCSSANPLDANCDAVVAGLPYLQVSGCGTDAAIAGMDTVAASLTLRRVDCVNPASIRRYQTHIYFIANNNIGGDGIPTLKRWELGTGIVPLVEGIENLQIEYGVDASGDSIPDAYTSSPATIKDWWDTMAVRIGLLARNEGISSDYTDTKSYVLAGTVYGPYNDNYRRHAYTSVVKLSNPSGRREP